MPTRSVLREDHLLFQQQADRFVAAEILPHINDWETDGITPRALWRKAGDSGLLNCALPPPAGKL
jgi:alkylation response protein AidB-like acyl-CoA dehydrogenase